ncbi:MAG: hypothetical protein AABZ65_01380 [Candidatus Omnitrophota bacterium]
MLLSLDERKRIPLGKILRAAKSNATLYNAEMVEGKIVLEPMMAVPEHEAWLYKNSAALSSVRRGLSEKPKHKLPDMSK